MVVKKIITICQSGGEFETDADGVISYKGGDAHAMEIDDKLKFKDLKSEVAEMFGCNLGTVAVKYFLPGNKKTLISISNDKDLKRMIKFHNDSDTAEIYVVTEEVAAPDVSQMPGSRSSRTTLSEAGVGVPVEPSRSTINNIVDDINEPDPLVDSTFDVVGDTNVSTEVPVPSDFPTPIAFASPYDEKLAKAAQQWQNNITGVGQRFNSVHEFREALRKYAIAHQFAFKYKKNDSHRVTVKCKAEGCQWRVHASRLSTTPLICIKKMNPTHTCEGSVLATGYQATRSWVASIIKEKLKVFPNYKPKDIVTDIKEEYGVQLNYFQAWRGKEIAKEQLQGSYKEAYSQLPYLCEKIMETNPGSLASFATKEDSSFHHLFVSFRASLYGFEQGCRPLLFLDSIFLKSKYQGSLLAATAADADDGFFPVAFAIVNVESDENWKWFLQQLKTALSTTPRGLTFVADREKGLKESIAEIFQGQEVYHAYCLRYLSEQLIRDLKGQFSHEVKRIIIQDMFTAAHAPTEQIFYKCVDSIKAISVTAYNWIMQSDPTHWANAFFQGARYNHMTSNFGELFYSWVSDAHELPITQLVDAIRTKIMELVYSRHMEALDWMRRLTPSMEKKLEKENLNVRALEVVSLGDRIEVRFENSVQIVNVDRWECSCRVWQLTGLPCCHAIAVIMCLQRDPYDFCSRYFTTESYRLTYAETLNPISNSDGPMWQKGESTQIVTVTPPPTRRPPGRPTTKRVSSQEVGRRQLQCSRCKGIGHNKSTCKEFLLEC
ncbi:hypothetical protein MIMGU_mgv1a001676mg [Erythranthe guttata]|uniref:SWIM-type domain-containing protein n=1 Tax=Erythranthe guttata TaxID=4155 RepID=A0A022R3Y3_ERYGU|nr:PREDICTED: uncharacterized protein LOC105960204 [Erythranthe guttata]EYU35362.1 hypothetical protein MIMGU_mgv1a001676mg [Erythranthe guttata]|eukprot:XP_012839829.1 PREDICTED: uncharacterized protein LOC105960204 [Erythranthe guttata]